MLGLIWDSHRKAKERYTFFRRLRKQHQEHIKQKVSKAKPSRKKEKSNKLKNRVDETSKHRIFSRNA